MVNDHGRDADAPALDERVVSLLSAAAAPSEPGPLPGEGAALAAYRASLTSARRPSMLTSLTSAKLGLAALLGTGALLTGGVAAAATGTLPGAAQDTAREILGTVGFDVPGAERAGVHPHTRGSSDQAPSDAGDDTTEVARGHADAGGQGKGEEISGLATADEPTGVEKGALVSDAASEGRSRAGDHGSAGGHARPDDRSAAGEERRDREREGDREHGADRPEGDVDAAVQPDDDADDAVTPEDGSSAGDRDEAATGRP